MIRTIRFIYGFVFWYALNTTVFVHQAYGQYGLGFAGQEVMQDQRTGLNLNADKAFSFHKDFELSFELSFFPGKSDYFGYILRIIGNGRDNIDLIYDRSGKEKYFQVIRGDKFSKIAFDIDTTQLFDEWTKIHIRFDVVKQELSLTSDKKEFKERLSLGKENEVKILFGANSDAYFATTDLPAMKIRNIQVSEDGRLKYHWPLNERAGSVAVDMINGRKASVSNPMWMHKMHTAWQPLRTLKVDGEASIAFDPKKEQVFLIGADSLLAYHVSTGKTAVYAYQSGPLQLVNGNQSFYDTTENRLINFYLDEHFVSVFNFETHSWSKNYGPPREETNYSHLNKFYHAEDSSLYFIGGYGHFLYKNDVHRYDFSKDRWNKIVNKGAFFAPRYLAALGATAKGAYILGGYGSASGQQILNPKQVYDLTFFDPKHDTFTKKYELAVEEAQAFTFANSLVINEEENEYYGMVFSKHQYHAQLQMIKGSLTKPVFQRVGDQIPYLFYDARSFADLFYCPKSRRFIAVTTFHGENGLTTAKIYAIYAPPINSMEDVVVATPKKASYLLWGFSALILFLAGGALAFYKKRQILKQQQRRSVGVPAAPNVPETMNEDLVTSFSVVNQEDTDKHQCAIFLFGTDIQLFDKEGNDITCCFTPLLKELFLILLLYTLRWGRGISSERLTALLWPDKTVESARNNRSVNVAKLKAVLDKLGHCSIVKETGHWKIKIADPGLYIDYKQYLTIIHEKTLLDKQRIIDLSTIVQRGGFLSQADYEWLDPFKAEISNEIIDAYLHFANTMDIPSDPEFMVQLANHIFYFDPVNEEAMIIKCQALAYLGKHSLTTQVFELFRKEYELIYGETYQKDLKTILATAHAHLYKI